MYGVRLPFLPCCLVCAAALSVPQSGNEAAAHPERRQGGVQIIGAGRQRTGTESLHAALVLLGYRAAHGLGDGASVSKVGVWIFGHDVYDPLPPPTGEEDARLWGSPLWNVQRTWIGLEGYTALTDSPFNNHYSQLARDYPRARVILTVHPRGARHWAASAIKDGLSQPGAKGFSPVPGCHVVGDTPAARASCARAYDAWNRHVVDTVPGERLLVFNVSQGWGPLCAFLGIPLPQNRTFPSLDYHDENVTY